MEKSVRFIIFLAVALAALGLGFWQLGRLKDRRTRNAIAASGLSLPPLVDSAGALPLPAYRTASLRGTLDESREFILRNRLVRGVPAVQIVTPLRREGSDTAVLVNRGYVPATDATDPGSATWSEAGRHTFDGILLPMPDRGDGEPIRHRDRESWRALDLSAMRRRLPYPVASVYLLAQATDSDGAAHTVRGTAYPFRADVPPMDDGPHLLYAVQWFGIAAAVAAFGWLVVYRRPAPNVDG